MSKRPTVLVLMGGPDAEREVSIMSGTEVAAALRSVSTPAGGFRVVDRTIDQPTMNELLLLVQQAQSDVIFPVLHGRWGEGGPLQEMLETIGLPFVGAGSQAAALAMDKLATKAVAASHGVPVAPSQELRAGDPCTVALPLVIKPVDDGSSVDLRICKTPDQLAAARAELHKKRSRLMAEGYIQGREITVGLICGQALPLIEIIPADAVEFYDYQAKYFRDDTRYVLDPVLPAGVAEQCADISVTVWQALGCRDLARVDLMVDSRGPWFLEINTIPGFTTHSLVPMAARHAGTQMADLCAKLVNAALARGASQRTSSVRAAV